MARVPSCHRGRAGPQQPPRVRVQLPDLVLRRRQDAAAPFLRRSLCAVRPVQAPLLAAGGVAAGLAAYCNAKLVNGIEYFLSITGFEKALQKADIVITGEGKIDAQTLQGKGPYGVAVKAKEKNIPVIGAAGNVPLENNKELQQYFDVLFSINNEATDINTAMQHTKANLIRTGAIIGKLISISQKIKAV